MARPMDRIRAKCLSRIPHQSAAQPRNGVPPRSVLFVGPDLPVDDRNGLKEEYGADGYNIFDSSVVDGGRIERYQ